MSLDLGQEPLGPDDCGEPKNQRIAWSRVSRRFFYVYYSNPSMIFVKVIFFTSPLLS